MDTKLRLDRLQKIALARIFYDLIEADFIIEEQEMNLLEFISIEKLKLTNAMLTEAKKMPIDKAISLLKELDSEQRQIIINLLKTMSLSDGTCVPLEAIQIFAIEQALSNNAFVYSVPAKDIEIDNMTVIYIENELTPLSKMIGRNHRTIRQEFLIAGFEFVYIPFVVDDYRQMNIHYLQRVVQYMLPSISQERTNTICADLRDMTTARFCRDLLYKKIKIPLIDARPSLLFKISESSLVEQFGLDDAERQEYANFLRIELKEYNTLEQIHKLVDSYHQMINCPITVNSMPPTKKFRYEGFHRSLFDLVVYSREQKEYRLIFDVSKPNANVYFEPLDGSDERIPVKLNPQETTLFLMIVKTSLEGEGLDWRDNPPSEIKQSILNEYNRIYYRIGKGKTTKVYKDRTQTNHIKTRIRSIQCVANMDMFVPEHVKKDNKCSYYRVKATIKHIEIKE